MTLKEQLEQGREFSARVYVRKCFRVYEDTDKTEGKSGRILRYVVDTKAEADKLAVGLGVWGRPGEIVESKEIVIVQAEATTSGFRYSSDRLTCDLKDLREPVKEDRARLAAQARAKLTDEEAFALGIGSK